MNSRCPSGPETPFDLNSSWVMDRSNGLRIDAITGTQSKSLKNDPTLATTTATVTVHKSDGNSIGIDAGVGVGVPLLVALLVSLGFLWHERKKNRTLHRQKQDAPDDFQYDGHGSHATPTVQQQPMQEQNNYTKHPVQAELNHGSGINEMSGRMGPAELDDWPTRNELPSQRL